MKKVIKNPLFTFILGIVITSSIAGVVAMSYNAKDVGYTPSDSTWNVNNVEDAIKSLKQVEKEGRIDFNNLSVSKNAVVGTKIANRTTSLQLDPGKYLIFASFSLSTGYTGTAVIENSTSNFDINVNCNVLSGYHLVANSSDKLASGQKAWGEETNAVLYCDIKQKSTVIINDGTYASTKHASTLTMHAVKIGN